MSPPRDVYANLLRDTRGLRRDQAGVRDVWYASLSWERKEESLFELEMLLKGFACYGNLRNHVGPLQHAPAVAHDFREEMRVVRDALGQTVEAVRALLGEVDRAFTFTRYLETVLPEDALRAKLIQDQLTQDTPTESLFVLRNTFESFHEMSKVLARSGRVSHRTFFALLNTISREVGRNTYFNPLTTLEFRPEFDRIHDPAILDALHRIGHDAAHRVVTLAFLTLYRALRYIALVDRYAADPGTVRRGYVILAVCRSDLRTLTGYLTHRAADAIADGFEKELLAVPRSEVAARFEALAETAGRLSSLRATLEALAHSIDIEVKRAFDREIPVPAAIPTDADLSAQLVVATATLRATLHHAIHVLFGELAPQARAPELASDAASRRAGSERLRRDVWMFSQILRAFVAKARVASAEESDRWASLASFQFVREFLRHFRAIGYQLVRVSDYGRLDSFLLALEALRDADLLEPDRMARVVEECDAFRVYLNDLFRAISLRAELTDVAFDKQDAAETLRIYLGAA